jgi:hypothetical protein
MTIRKDKKFKYGEAMRSISRPPSTLSKQDKKSIVDGFYKKEEIAKAYYDLAKPAATAPDAMKAKRLENFADVVIRDATQKFERDHTGLNSILLADASKPPTLDEYIRLGLSLAQLSDEERKSIQWMLDRSNPKPEDKK